VPKFDPAIFKAINSQPAAIELLIKQPVTGAVQRGALRRQAIAAESRLRVSNRNEEFSPEAMHTTSAIPEDAQADVQRETSISGSEA
jgi:hypothetical protein